MASIQPPAFEEIGSSKFSHPPIQAEVQALRSKLEPFADDLWAHSTLPCRAVLSCHSPEPVDGRWRELATAWTKAGAWVGGRALAAQGLVNGGVWARRIATRPTPKCAMCAGRLSSLSSQSVHRLHGRSAACGQITGQEGNEERNQGSSSQADRIQRTDGIKQVP